MNDQDLLRVVRAAFGELSLPMHEQRAQELAQDALSLRQRISKVSGRLDFDHLPGDFQRELRAGPLAPSAAVAGESCRCGLLWMK